MLILLIKATRVQKKEANSFYGSDLTSWSKEMVPQYSRYWFSLYLKSYLLRLMQWQLFTSLSPVTHRANWIQFLFPLKRNCLPRTNHLHMCNPIKGRVAQTHKTSTASITKDCTSPERTVLLWCSSQDVSKHTSDTYCSSSSCAPNLEVYQWDNSEQKDDPRVASATLFPGLQHMNRNTQARYTREHLGWDTMPACHKHMLRTQSSQQFH